MRIAGDKKAKSGLRLLILFAGAVLSISLIIGLIGQAFVKPPTQKPQIEPNPTQKPSTEGQNNKPETPEATDPGQEINKDVFTMLLCGTDVDQTRTDTIMVLSFDTKKKTASILSVPRDTIIVSQNRKGASQKINSAYGIGGIDLTKEDLKTLLGINIDYYAILSFDGFEQIVDVIGGFDYELTRDYKYDDPDQDLHIDLKKGQQKLNGMQTLQLLRFRKGYANGDMDRIDFQQKFLKEAFKQAFSFKNITKIPEMVGIAANSFKTDMPYGEMLWMATAVSKMKGDEISMDTLPGVGEYMGQISYYFVNQKEMLLLLNEKYNPYSSPITKVSVFKNTSVSTTSSTKKPAANTTKPTETKEDEADQAPKPQETPPEESAPPEPGTIEEDGTGITPEPETEAPPVETPQENTETDYPTE